MLFAAIDIIKGADFLIYPLGLCSFVFVYVFAERCYALRAAAVIPDALATAIIEGKTADSADRQSVLSRILDYTRAHPNDAEGAKAFARLEITRLERGLSYLDLIYAGAPLIGLTGTVWALIRVFSSITAETGLPDPVQFTGGVSLALSATLIGLSIAVPALFGCGYLQRKVETYAAQLDVLLERILTSSRSES